MKNRKDDWSLLIGFFILLIAFMFVIFANIKLREQLKLEIIAECDEEGYEVDYRTRDFIVCKQQSTGNVYIRAKKGFIEEWCSYIKPTPKKD